MAPMSPCTTKAGCARSRTRAECPRVQCTAFAPRSVCVTRRGAMGEIVFLLDATRAKRNAKLTYFPVCRSRNSITVLHSLVLLQS